MTKRELFEVLEGVPDDAKVHVMGNSPSIVVHSPEDNYATLDEKGGPFEASVRD